MRRKVNHVVATIVLRENLNKFTRLLRDMEREYGCSNKFLKLTFLIKLLDLKVINDWSNRSFYTLLELLKDALPDGETLLKSHYEAKKVVHDLDLGYVPIHACINNCVLFWREHENDEQCPICGECRYKYGQCKCTKKIPQKVLRYFLLTLRLERLYMSTKTATDMR